MTAPSAPRQVPCRPHRPISAAQPGCQGSPHEPLQLRRGGRAGELQQLALALDRAHARQRPHLRVAQLPGRERGPDTRQLLQAARHTHVLTRGRRRHRTLPRHPDRTRMTTPLRPAPATIELRDQAQPTATIRRHHRRQPRDLTLDQLQRTRHSLKRRNRRMRTHVRMLRTGSDGACRRTSTRQRASGVRFAPDTRASPKPGRTAESRPFRAGREQQRRRRPLAGVRSSATHDALARSPSPESHGQEQSADTPLAAANPFAAAAATTPAGTGKPGLLNAARADCSLLVRLGGG